MKTNTLYLVIPCYNEEAVLPETARIIGAKMHSLIQNKTISGASKALFVNDGSKDATWGILSKLHASDSLFSCVNLSRNCGHQNAVVAGLMTAMGYCDIAISLDADLQDDVNAIDEMIEKSNQGFDIVYGVRSSRLTDSFFKRWSAECFYKFMRVMGVDIVFNHADYRLTNAKVLKHLSEFSETNMFLRGIFPLIGYKSTNVYYERKSRAAGESKYPLKKMIYFAIDGITSFSTKPLKIITALGFLTFCASFIALLYAIVGHFFSKTEIGWTSLICSIWMIGGLQILCIGVIGEYVGKIYTEVKRRPKYFISEFLK